MSYSISQMAEKFDLKPHTLRFYESQGLIFPGKTKGGVRRYSEQDAERLSLLCCLKDTGMSLKDIKQFFDLCDRGEETTAQRLEIFQRHREHILSEIVELQRHLQKIEKKILVYEDRCK